MTSRTSIIGTRFISGSSRCAPRRKSMLLRPFAVHDLHQLDGLRLHLDYEVVNFGPEVAVEDHARDGHDQAECGVVESNGDAVRELLRVTAHARPALRAEDLDHADNRSEQPHD